MRHLTKDELDMVSGGEVKTVGVCREDSGEKFVKMLVTAVVNYLKDLW